MKRRKLLKRCGWAVSTTVAISGCSGLSPPNEVIFSVEYFEDWSGAFGEPGSMRSISGTGSDSYVIKRLSTVAGYAQKRELGGGPLTVSISVGDEVVAESVTSSASDVARVSHSF